MSTTQKGSTSVNKYHQRRSNKLKWAVWLVGLTVINYVVLSLLHYCIDVAASVYGKPMLEGIFGFRHVVTAIVITAFIEYSSYKSGVRNSDFRNA
jgi:hypothetical protein